MEDIKIIYSIDKVENVLINYFNNSLTTNNNKNATFVLENNILKINWDYNKIETFIKNEKIYLDEVDTYQYINNEIELNETNLNNNMANINIIHNDWKDICIIENNYLYRLSNNEGGLFEINNDILTIKWEKWDEEKFIQNNGIYYLLNDIFIYHKDWSENCVISNNKIFRKNNINEYGNFKFENNRLFIYWEKWDYEIFINFNENKNIYYSEKILLNDNLYLYNTINNNIYENFNLKGNYLFNNNKLIINWNNQNIKEYNYNIENNIINKYDINDYLNNDINNDNNDNSDITKLNNEILNNLNNKNLNNENLNSKNLNNENLNNENLNNENLNNENLNNENLNNENKKIILKKDFKEEFIITNHKIKLNDKEGTYKLENNLLTIFWDDDINTELYILKNNIYYYKDYNDILNKNYILITNNDIYENIKINYYKKIIIINDNIKYNFIEKDNIFYILTKENIEIFNLYILNEYNILIISNKYNKIFNNDDYIDYNIFRSYYNKLNELSNYEILLLLLNNYEKYKIYSIKTFLIYHSFFNINGYMINNFIENENDAIIHWLSNKLSSFFFYSSNNIEIVYNNMLFENSVKTIYIINLENDFYLKNILDFIPKNKYVIINFNLKDENFIDNKYSIYENYIINNFNNIIITKSINKTNIDIIKFINNIINNLNYENIFYITHYIDNLYNIDINIINNEIIIINNEINIITYQNLINKLFDILIFNIINHIYSIKNIIEIIIYKYILKKNIYYIFENNFIINNETINNILR
jgi:hypothetical protein